MRAWTLVLVAAGCSSPVTEAKITVSASGLTVGVDINHLHLAATDVDADFSGFDQTVPLCPDAGGGPPGCHQLPLSVVLYPGPRSPGDTVRVLVEGLRDDTLVLSSVGKLTFTHGVRQRLDFVLYGVCLDRLDCSGSDAVCDANGMCTHINPTMGNDDLSMPSLSDLAVNNGGDLAESTNPDLLGVDGGGCGDQDQPCCSAATCNDFSLACFNGTCQSCGTSGAWCCPYQASLCGAGLGCDASFHCFTCGGPGQPCCAGSTCNGSLCSLGICQSPGCGQATQPCCGNGECARGVACVSSVCTTVACMGNGPTCCSPTTNPYCASGSYCYNGTCELCGDYEQGACSTNPPCNVPYQPYFATGTCELCNAPGFPCCGGATGVCSDGYTCGNVDATCL